MKIDIQFVRTEKNPYVEDLLIKKLNKLDKKYDWIISATALFKQEKRSAGKGKICEVRLSVPGPRIFASSDEESFEKAADETVKDLIAQLKDRKSEMKPHI